MKHLVVLLNELIDSLQEVGIDIHVFIQVLFSSSSPKSLSLWLLFRNLLLFTLIRDHDGMFFVLLDQVIIQVWHWSLLLTFRCYLGDCEFVVWLIQGLFFFEKDAWHLFGTSGLGGFGYFCDDFGNWVALITFADEGWKGFGKLRWVGLLVVLLFYSWVWIAKVVWKIKAEHALTSTVLWPGLLQMLMISFIAILLVKA